MKRIIRIMLTAVILATLVAVPTGCSNNNTEATQTTPATQTATQAVTQTASQAATQTTTQAATQKDTDGENTYAGLTQDAALDKAVTHYAGYYANSIYRGKDPNGGDAWVVEMTDTVSDSFTAYVTEDGVTSSRDPQSSTFAGEADPDSYAGIPEQEALLRAVEGIGEGWSASYASKGKYQGVDCWVVTIMNTDGETRKAYVTYDACYYG